MSYTRTKCNPHLTKSAENKGEI